MMLTKAVVLGAVALLAPLGSALSASDISSDTPVSQLISSATAALSKGNAQDALTYFDVAVARDPQNYMTIFRRGAAYLQLGKGSYASQDFDRVLAIKPTFEAALVQRANIRSRNGDFTKAIEDYKKAGKKNDQEVKAIQEAQGADKISADAEASGDWSSCTINAGIAINVAHTHIGLRQRRAKCRFEKGELIEAISDLIYVAQLSSSSEAYQKISATYFFALDESENGLSHIRKCLHSDPDSRSCSKLLKNEKAIDKQLKKVKDLMDKHSYNGAVKLLIPSAEDPGLLKEVVEATESLKEQGLIPKQALGQLYNRLIELTCEAYTEVRITLHLGDLSLTRTQMNNIKRAEPYCTEALKYNPACLPALIGKATREMDAENFEEAVRTLHQAKEHHPGSQRAKDMADKAAVMEKRSKQKDYYKVLGVSSDADERDIKRAYRKLTVKNHPDKASQQGISPEEAQKRMSTINEAYEVLSDPELKARFDRGDDPNDNSQQQGNPFQGSQFGGQPVFFRQGSGGGQQFKFQQGGFGGFPF